jgi:hypothetical protein
VTAYSDQERLRQVDFKQSWPDLPDAARDQGTYRGKRYPFVLPGDYAVHNLWEPIRKPALAHFHEHDIAWHDGSNKVSVDESAPSPHLLDSQVCAINFWWGLGRSREALTGSLRLVFDDVSKVVAPEGGGPLLEPEWVGKKSYLGEKGWPSRGKYATSADLLLAYEDSGGHRHGVLVESKYTESYAEGDWRDRGSKGRTRIATYAPLFERIDSPVNPDLTVGLRELLIEPFYQHLRQQFLAAEMERERELEFDTVTCLHVSPRANRAFHSGMTAPRMKDFGESVGEAWEAILCKPDRYRSVAYEDLFAGAIRIGDPTLADWTEYQDARYGWGR